MAATETRTSASSGSSIPGSGTARTETLPSSSKTTARTAVPALGRAASRGLVEELGGHAGREMDELVRGAHVSDDRGQVALELQLSLHHALHRIEVPGQDLLPPGVRSAHDVPGFRALLGGHDAASPALPVPQVEPGPRVAGHVLVGFGLEHKGHIPLPVRGGIPVLLRSVDAHHIELEPLVAWKDGHRIPPPSPIPSHPYRTHRRVKMRVSPITLNVAWATMLATMFPRRWYNKASATPVNTMTPISSTLPYHGPGT